MTSNPITQGEWQNFQALGDPERSFERLWRSIVKGCYSQHGSFIEYKNNPGVEFVVKLKEGCELGKAGDLIGWQCKYFESLFDATALSKVQKDAVVHSLEKTFANFPNVKCWILCVPRNLVRRDIDWLMSKQTGGVRIELWTDADIADKLLKFRTGELVRDAYFGKLVLTAADLLHSTRMAYAPIKSRWLPDVHFCGQAEKRVRELLLEPTSRPEFDSELRSFEALSKYIDEAGSVFDPVRDRYQSVREAASDVLKDFQSGEYGSLDTFEELARSAADEFHDMGLVLRRARNRFAPVTSNLVAHATRMADIVSEIKKDIATPAIAVMADAGCGKTHMSISLIEKGFSGQRGGILMLAKNLKSGDTIDDLIARLMFPGRIRITSLEELLVALDEYGSRYACRVPWVIDGLNESQDPAMWHSIIAQILEAVRGRYKHVLLVVTLRTGQCSWRDDKYGFGGFHVSDDQLFAYRKVCVPEEVECLRGYIPDAKEMAERYLEYYKISYDGVHIPWTLQHPLMLRLYCESVNRNRQNWVRAGSLPYDITDIFDSYCMRVASNISQNSSIPKRRRDVEYRQCVRNLGKLLLEGNARAQNVRRIVEVFPENDGGWEADWENVLSTEGLIAIRPDWDDKTARVFEAAYDGLAGYLIADYLLELNESSCLEQMEEKVVSRKHELSDDIFSFLTWGYPRHHHGRMLYKALNEPQRSVALKKTVDVDAGYITEEVIDDLIAYAHGDEEFAALCFYKVFSRPTATRHPINFVFLDKLLRGYECGDRDRVWGKWVFGQRDGIYGRISRVLERIDEIDANDLDQFFCFMKWMLGSNVLSIRDRATHVLVCLGRRFPDAVLLMIQNSMPCSDPYVLERLAASAYGIFMAMYSAGMDQELVEYGRSFCASVASSVLCEHATNATANMLVLDHLINAIALVREIDPTVAADIQIPYRVLCSPFRELSEIDSDSCRRVGSAIHMDFGNYTLTRLVGAHSYDTDGKKYRKVRAQIEQRMYDLGYRANDFEWEDQRIQEMPYRPKFDRDPLNIERFGKKYSWIAFREMEAVLKGRIFAFNRTNELDIDPSFPGAPPQFPFVFSNEIFDATGDIEDWMARGTVPEYKDLRVCTLPDEGESEWVLLHSIVERQSQLKECYTMVKGFFTKKGMLPLFQESPRLLGDLESPSKYYSFVGEVPWSKQLRFDEDQPKRSLRKSRPCRHRVKIDSDEEYDYFVWFEVPVEYFNAESKESDENKDAAGYVLAHHIALSLGLRMVATRWAMVDRFGNDAVLYYKDGESYQTSRHFLYIRKDLLEKYCSANNLAFAWEISGERRMHYTEVDKHRDFLKQLGWDAVRIHKVEGYVKR